MRWKARFWASSVAPSGRVSLRKASSSASAGRCGFNCGQGIAQPLRQHHVAVIAPLRTRPIGSDVGSMGHLPADIRQPVEGDLFDIGFGEGGHGEVQGLKTSTLVSRR